MREDLRALVDGAATPEDLDDLIGALEGARARAWARRLAAVAATTPPADGDLQHMVVRWLTPVEAAELAQVKPTQIYNWSRGKRWASRPSRKCLRIDETAFRKWLHARTS